MTGRRTVRSRRCWERNQSGEVGRVGFTGGQQDPNGQVWLHARTYDPTLGRFLSVDPVRPGASGVAGYNPYTYVGNNPTTFTDPTGQVAAVGNRTQRLVAAAAATARAGHTSCVIDGCYDGLGYELEDAFRRMRDLLLAGVAGAGTALLTRTNEPEVVVGDPPVDDPEPEGEPQDGPKPPPIITDVDDDDSCQPQEVAVWKAGLRPVPVASTADWADYQRRVTGFVEYQVQISGRNVYPDGILEPTCSLQDAKQVGNAAASPYTGGSTFSPIVSQEKAQLRKYNEVIDRDPVTNVQLYTNVPEAVPVLTGWLLETATPGAAALVR